jgi:hypothetical protein
MLTPVCRYGFVDENNAMDYLELEVIQKCLSLSWQNLAFYEIFVVPE